MENVLSGGVRREMRDEKWCKADGGDCVMNATYELYLNGLGWEEERIFTR